MTSVDDILSRHKPSHAAARILLDGDLRDELGRLEARLRDAQRAEIRGGVNVGDVSSPIPLIQSEYAALAERAERAKTEFRFQALPRDVVDDIKRRHPPTPERWERYREEAKGNVFAPVPKWDSDGAAPELISRALVEVDGEPVNWSEADAARLWSALSPGQAEYLFEQLWSVQSESGSDPLSVTVTGGTTGSETSSTTPPATESPSPSS
jgi:hypothetical protein